MVVCCHLQSFQNLRVLTASCSSISGKHSVACFISVISRLKRFPFWFSRVNFVVLGIISANCNCCDTTDFELNLM
jgi:hypothetical protein